MRRIALISFLLVVLCLVGFFSTRHVSCDDIYSQVRCNIEQSCYWTEDFEHDGVGPTGVYYCESSP